MKKNLVVIAALMVGMVLGAAGMAAYYGPIAEITAEIVAPSGGGGGGSGGPGNVTGTISLNVGQLVAGQHYSFDDVEGYTWLQTGGGGSFDIVLSHNTTAFDYVRVKIEIEETSSHDSSDDNYYEFYLDTNNPSYTVDLPAGKTMKIKVELEEISVSANASPGSYVISVDLFGP